MIRALTSLALSAAVVLLCDGPRSADRLALRMGVLLQSGLWQLASSEVEEGPVGYRIRLTGEIIPYSDARIKLSKDEFFHQCTPGGVIDAIRSICLYVPDRGY